MNSFIKLKLAFCLVKHVPRYQTNFPLPKSACIGEESVVKIMWSHTHKESSFEELTELLKCILMCTAQLSQLQTELHFLHSLYWFWFSQLSASLNAISGWDFKSAAFFSSSFLKLYHQLVGCIQKQVWLLNWSMWKTCEHFIVHFCFFPRVEWISDEPLIWVKKLHKLCDYA